MRAIQRAATLLCIIGGRCTTCLVVPSHHTCRVPQIITFSSGVLPQIRRYQHLGMVSTEGMREDLQNPQEVDSKINLQPQMSSATISKLRILKDRMWVRETLEDLTSAEFACSLAPGSSDDKGGIQKKSSVDFENILQKLNRRIEDMCTLTIAGEDNSDCIISHPLGDVTINDLNDGLKSQSQRQCWSLMKKSGMGSVTYTDDQRSALVM